MNNIRKILSSDCADSIITSFCANVIVFFILSLITVSLESRRDSLIVLESPPNNYEIYEEPVEILDIKNFDQEVTVIKPPSESALSVVDEMTNIVPTLDIGAAIVTGKQIGRAHV